MMKVFVNLRVHKTNVKMSFLLDHIVSLSTTSKIEVTGIRLSNGDDYFINGNIEDIRKAILKVLNDA